MGKLCGIYCIESIVDGKKYIGQSVNIHKRWYEHKSKLKSLKHDNYYLQNAFNKYGENNFIFKILLLCSAQELDDKEKYFISFYKTNKRNFGYNLTIGGKSFIEDEAGKNIVDYINNKKVKVLQIDLSGKLVKEWDSVMQIFKENPQWTETGLRQCLRRSCNKSNKGCKTYKNFIWVYKDYFNQDFINNLLLDISKKNKGNEDRKIKVYQYDLNGTLVKIWDSVNELRRNHFYIDTIRKSIENSKPYKNFYWAL